MSESVRILGTGSYVPEKVLTNLDLEKLVETSDEWITQRTGIKERHIVSQDQAASDLATEAAKRALEMAKLEANDIDMILVATISPDMFFPSTACIVEKNLGINNKIAFDISAACSGFLYGISIAEKFIKTKAIKRALVIGVEILSKIVDWTDRSTCVLFGDGAGAVVLGDSDEGAEIVANYLSSDGELGSLLMMPAGGSRMPATIETVEKRLHYVKMEGNSIFKNAVKAMTSASKEVLNLASWKKEEVDFLIPHQANLRIIKSTQEFLGLKDEQVYVNIDKYGNTSSASIPIALDEANRKGLLKKGDKVVLVAFGGGFTWAASAIKW